MIFLDAVTDAEKAIAIAGDLLAQCGLVAIPTETVYGLAARISCPDALERIFAVKDRPHDNPLIVHVATAADADAVGRCNAFHRVLMEMFWPGPLTLVVPNRTAPHLVTGGSNTVAVRMPASSVTLAIITRAGGPVAAPSANKSGRPSPTEARHVVADLGDSVDAVVDAGPAREGLESTVLLVDDSGSGTILRPGPISLPALARLLPRVAYAQADTAQLAASPGTRYRHYAPDAQVVLVETSDEIARYAESLRATGESFCILSMEPELGGADWQKLTPFNLYSLLRQADTLRMKKIIVHWSMKLIADRALSDRVRRSAGL